jgi:hypothetical protein
MEDLSENIFSAFKSRCLDFIFYSAVMDETGFMEKPTEND